MLSHPLYRAGLNFGMKNLFQNNNKKSSDFLCKECKMVFSSKESLERHKKKARHFGAVNLR
jgi:hypothetical protein